MSHVKLAGVNMTDKKKGRRSRIEPRYLRARPNCTQIVNRRLIFPTDRFFAKAIDKVTLLNPKLTVSDFRIGKNVTIPCQISVEASIQKP